MARTPKYKQQPKCLIICEDSKSSKDYLHDAISYYRVNSLIKAEHLKCTDPLNIVNKAIAKAKAYDFVFCVIDRDNHATFDQALTLAKTNSRVRMITSYPCYEFWFCLHSKYQRRPYTSAGNKSAGCRLIDDLVKTGKPFTSYKKGGSKGLFRLVIQEHEQKYIDAHARADRIINEVDKDGQLNPSTKIHLLLRYVEKLSSPQLID